MLSVVKKWSAACGLIFFLCAATSQATNADEAEGPMPRVTPAASRSSAASPNQVDNLQLLIALADPDPSVSSTAPSSHPASPKKVVSWPTPARFFTINQVLANHSNGATQLEFASVLPTDLRNDRPDPEVPPTQGEEPFGLYTFRAPDGQLSEKWRTVEADIQAEDSTLERCRTNASTCTPAAARFVAIIKDAAGLNHRARLQLVNERVNAAIRYVEDSVQWHKGDVWSAPLDVAHKGSFDTGLGDCEDYAIAKYVALRHAGVPESNLRLLLVKDQAVHLDHAVLAARDESHWVILDNRWSRLADDNELRQFLPLFALNRSGVKLFAAPYANRSAPPAAKPRAPESPTYMDAGLAYSVRIIMGASGALPLLM
jgi:predicted transglutaminase-like cysteine proteinase